MEGKMNYPYKNKPPVDKITECRKRIEVLEWEAITGETPTWYCYEQIFLLEREIDQLQEIICDSLMNETRKIG